MAVRSLAAAALLLAGPALAQVPPPAEIPLDEGDVGLALLAGPGLAFDGDGHQVRLEVRSYLRLVQGMLADLRLVLPVSASVAAERAFDLDLARHVFDVAPSLRAEVLTEGRLAPYVEAGAGVGYASRRLRMLPEDVEDPRAVWTTRTTAGLVVSDPGTAFSVIVEPIGVRFYGDGDSLLVRYTAMVGVRSMI